MDPRVVEVGQLIREARERRGWSQGELAAHLGRSQTAVSYWEAGRRALGVDDLVHLAAVLGVSPAELLPNGGPRRPVPTLLRAVAEKVDAYKLADELEKFALEAEKLPPLPILWNIAPSSPRDTAEALLSAARISKPPVPVDELLEGCGVRIMKWDFGDDIDGLTVKLPTGVVAWINPNQAPARQRFTLAHELGHHLLRHADEFHVDFGGNYSPVATGGHPDYDWRAERAANDFAANLLMPTTLVREYHLSCRNLQQLARTFHVSAAAMGYRLQNLHLD